MTLPIMLPNILAAQARGRSRAKKNVITVLSLPAMAERRRAAPGVAPCSDAVPPRLFDSETTISLCRMRAQRKRGMVTTRTGDGKVHR